MATIRDVEYILDTTVYFVINRELTKNPNLNREQLLREIIKSEPSIKNDQFFLELYSKVCDRLNIH